MTTEPQAHNDEDQDFCPDCHRHNMARQLLVAAVANGLAVGLDPNEIHEQVCSVLDAICGDDEPEEMTAETPTAGQA